MGKGIDVSSIAVNNPYSQLFGGSQSTSDTGSMSWMSGIGDLKSIQSGAYKKALKSLYDKQDKSAVSDAVANTISGSGTSDSEKNLSNVKSSAVSLYNATKDLRSTNFDTASDEDVAKKVESFVKGYNSTLNATKKLDSYGILQTQVWAVEKLESAESMLGKAGITINADNTLSLDKDALKNADKATLKTLFSGSGSIADSMNQKASSIINQATNQLATNTGKAMYSSGGTLF